MPHLRRYVLACAAGGLAGAMAVGRSQAQTTWPDRPIRLIIPFAPGGGSDIAGRLAAQCMTPHLRQQVVVENRSGAGGTIGMEAVVRSGSDGYTLALLTTSSAVLNIFLYRRLSFDIQRDLAAVAEVGRSPSVISARRNLAADVGALRSAASRSGGLTYGSGGNGTAPHLAGTMLARALGTEMTHVPFRSEGQAVTALVSGQIDLLVGSVPVLLSHIREGSVRAIAVAARAREPLLPEVPTASDAGLPGYEVDNWYGVFAPAATSGPVVGALAASLRAGLDDPACAERLLALGIYPGARDPASFTAYWRAEVARWAPIAEASGVRLD